MEIEPNIRWSGPARPGLAGSVLQYSSEFIIRGSVNRELYLHIKACVLITFVDTVSVHSVHVAILDNVISAILAPFRASALYYV